MREEILRELEKIVGEDDVSTDPVEIYVHSRDSALFQGFADVIVRPESTEEVSQILKLANDYKIPVYPRGSGTSICGGPIPVLGGIVLAMYKMNRIIEFDRENLMVTVEPGVICDDLNEFLAPYGYFFPPDPSSSSAATIGGMVGHNSAGNLAMKYGKTKDWIQWLEVVLPGGKVIRTGSNTLKSVSDYDLTKLFCASEGTLGVVTKIGMRVAPKPKYYRTVLFYFDDLRKAGNAIVNVRSSGVVPAALEIIDRISMKTAGEYTGMDLPEAEAMLIVQTDGLVEEQVQREIEICFEAAKKAEPIEWMMAETEEERNKAWAIRKACFPALARKAITTIIEDMCVPITKIPDALVEIQKIPERVNNLVSIGTYGHAGDGNLHPTFLFDERDPEEREAFFKATKILYDEVVLPRGGSITGEHGIGIARSKYIPKQLGKETIELMKGIKKVFDPNNIMNPMKGKPYGDEAIIPEI